MHLRKLFSGKKEFRTGVVLSGGGARGYAHAGILKALEELDLKPDIISGVSAGAIVGAMYADGNSPDEMFRVFQEEEHFYKFVKLTIPKRGLLRAEGLEEKLRSILKAEKLEDLQIKLIIAAANLNMARVDYFDTGEIIPRVLASSAIPILFNPVEIGGVTYIDGGMMDNLPVDPLYGRCEKVIGVSLNPIEEMNDFPNLLSIAERTFRINLSAQIKEKLSKCDIVIQPDELGKFGLLETGKGKEMFELGYQAAQKALKNYSYKRQA
jgi:NTE family protein